GDAKYAPPEKWYGHSCRQWNDEREAADAYMLGNLFVYMMTGTPMNSLLYNEIPSSLRPNVYRGMFDSQLIDVLKDAQSRALSFFVFPTLPVSDREELERMLLELTEPDPQKRGDRSARRSGLVGIDRFHQKLHRISGRIALEEGRAAS